MKPFLYFLLIAMYVLHNDFFTWHESSLIFGFPAGLFYQIVYCFAATILMLFLVRYAWPANLDETEDGAPGK
jgi:hypothetical protein